MAKGKRRRGRKTRQRANRISQGQRSSLSGNSLSRKLRLEQLEDRRLLALYVVNNFFDLDPADAPVVGSLRQAVEEANTNAGFDQIMFADFLFDVPSPFPLTITLNGGDNGGALLLTDVDGVDIIGPGAGILSVIAGGNNRAFLVDDGDENVGSRVSISGLGISAGGPQIDDEDGLGGAILNRESLTLFEVDVFGSFAPGGGGGVHNDTGFLTIENSLIRDNTSLLGGGGVQNGIAEQDDNLPTTRILNSTLTGNTAIGVPGDDDAPTGYGGGVLNLAGTVNIVQSTIYGNTSAAYGGGSATQGFDPELDEESGEAAVMSGPATTNIISSIIVGNIGANNAPDDVGSAGMTEETDDEPAAPFEPQINSRGFNLFGVLTHPATSVNPAVTLPPGGPGDVVGVDPTTVFVDDPDAMLPEAWLNDFGGVLPVFMPDFNKTGGQLAIDQGSPNVQGDFDQRGFQFSRTADLAGSPLELMDIGAAEVQLGTFEVTTLVDESDKRYADVPVSDGFFPLNSITLVPDFSLREALEFAEKLEVLGLPNSPTISFSSILAEPFISPDPTPGTPAPTILLTLGQLPATFPVTIQGPTFFELEIDAAGNDSTPFVNNGDGSRVFFVSSTVEISDLILMGGDQQEFGGGIFTSGDLTLRNITMHDNFTTGVGGGIYVASGDLLVDTSTLHDNISASSGGGIFLASGNVTVNNSTISGNTSTLHGGGIANADGNLLVRYSTITLNTAASTFGSGVASYRDAAALTEVRSSIISGNTINDIQHVRPGANNIVSLGYNLVGDGNAVLTGSFTAAGDQTFADALLAPLARLGGPTPVHRLLPGSPAVDAGDSNNAGLGNVPVQDQRGFPFDRIENSFRIDIGSFEVQDDVLLVGDVATDPDAGYATFVAALDESNLTPTKETIVFLPTWLGEFFPGTLEITDSVDIIGIDGFRFFGFPELTVQIDDGDDLSLLDVSFSNFRFENDVRVDNHENLTFTNMEFVNNSSLQDGGAISHQNGKLTISDSNFIGNSSAGTGGAIFVLNGDLEINNSFISGSSTGASGGNGGAIYIKDGDLTADYLYITGNVAPGATGAGGGIYGNNATIALSNAIISGNSTSGSNSDGGAIAAINSAITLTDTAISFNSTLGSQSSGGGIFINGGSLDIQNGNLSLNKTFGQDSSGGAIASINADVTITGTSISLNEVNGLDSHGGGVYVVGADLTIRDSSVTNNSATAAGSNGGGIFSDTNLSGSQTASVINSTVSGNTAALRGGGFYNADGKLEIKYSTVSDNSVPYFGNGGGVASFANSNTTRTEVRSSIIAGNFATADPVNPNSDVESVAGLSNSFVSLGYNVIGKGVSNTLDAFNQVGDQSNIVDPRLSPLTIDPTTLTFFHGFVFDPLVSSPAINAGDPNAVAGVGDVPTHDQIGAGRVDNGRIDVGAFESDLSPVLSTSAADFDSDSDVDGSDFLAWQRGFGLLTGANPSDGDADGNGAVDGDDLTIWATDYGTGFPAAVAASTEIAASSSQDILVAPLEPLPGAPVLVASPVTGAEENEGAETSADSQLLTGLTLTTVAAGIGSAMPIAVAEASVEVERDLLFADFATLAVAADYEDIASSQSETEELEEEELEFSLEDQVFELLGS